MSNSHDFHALDDTASLGNNFCLLVTWNLLEFLAVKLYRQYLLKAFWYELRFSQSKLFICALTLNGMLVDTL